MTNTGKRNALILAAGSLLLALLASSFDVSGFRFSGPFVGAAYAWSMFVAAWTLSRYEILKGYLDLIVFGIAAALFEILSFLFWDLSTAWHPMTVVLANTSLAALAGIAMRAIFRMGSRAVFAHLALLAASVVAHILVLLIAKTPEWDSGYDFDYDAYYLAWDELEKAVRLPSQLVALMLIMGLVGLMSKVRERLLARSSRKLSQRALPMELQVKAFLSARILAAVVVAFGASLVVFVKSFGLSMLAGALDSWMSDPAQYLLIPGVIFSVIGLLNVWIPSLIAYRAMQKGKSWDAFFWLSALVSPLIMWIIAEASADTRGMAPAQYAQQPVQYAPAAPQAPVAPATDTRPCPQCAEDIKAAAKLCKHCGSKVEPIA